MAAKTPARKVRKAGGKRSSGSRPSRGTTKRPSGEGPGPRKRTGRRSLTAATTSDGGKPKGPRKKGPRDTDFDAFCREAVAEMRASAARDADIYVAFSGRIGMPDPTRLHEARCGTEKDLFDASFEDDATFSPRLEHLAIVLALDPAGAKKIRPSDWTPSRNTDGTWTLRRRSFLPDSLNPPVTPPEPLIQEVFKAVFSHPRDLDLLRRTILRALPQEEEELVTLRQFLKEKKVDGKEITHTKDRWRHAVRDGRKALPPSTRKGRPGQPSKYRRTDLEPSWRAFRGEDVL